MLHKSQMAFGYLIYLKNFQLLRKQQLKVTRWTVHHIATAVCNPVLMFHQLRLHCHFIILGHLANNQYTFVSMFLWI